MSQCELWRVYIVKRGYIREPERRLFLSRPHHVLQATYLCVKKVSSTSLLFKKLAGGDILREGGVLDLDWQQRLQHGVNDENSLKEGHRSEISSGFPQIWLVRKIFRVPAALLLPFVAECLFRWLAPDRKKDLSYKMPCETPFAILFCSCMLATYASTYFSRAEPSKNVKIHYYPRKHYINEYFLHHWKDSFPYPQKRKKCRIKTNFYRWQWTGKQCLTTGPLYFVFCRLYPVSPQPPRQCWLLPVISLFLTNSVSPVRACLSKW